MNIPFGRLISLTAAMTLRGAGAAAACDPGDMQCSNGYRYVCQCWTVDGCNYYSSGVCDNSSMSLLDVLVSKYAGDKRRRS